MTKLTNTVKNIRLLLFSRGFLNEKCNRQILWLLIVVCVPCNHCLQRRLDIFILQGFRSDIMPATMHTPPQYSWRFPAAFVSNCKWLFQMVKREEKDITKPNDVVLYSRVVDSGLHCVGNPLWPHVCFQLFWKSCYERRSILASILVEGLVSEPCSMKSTARL